MQLLKNLLIIENHSTAAGNLLEGKIHIGSYVKNDVFKDLKPTIGTYELRSYEKKKSKTKLKIKLSQE